MKKSLLLMLTAIVSILIFTYSCGDDDESNGTGTGTGTGTGVTDNWIPLANGNYWVLEGNATDGLTGNITFVTETHTIIGDTILTGSDTVKYGEMTTHSVVTNADGDTLRDTTDTMTRYIHKIEGYFETGFEDTTGVMHWIRIIKFPPVADDRWQADIADNTSTALTKGFEDIITPVGEFSKCVFIDSHYKNHENDYKDFTNWYKENVGMARVKRVLKSGTLITLDLTDYRLY